MITFPRRVPHKRSGSDDDDRDESIALVLVESRSIVRWLAAAVRKLCGKVIIAKTLDLVYPHKKKDLIAVAAPSTPIPRRSALSNCAHTTLHLIFVKSLF